MTAIVYDYDAERPAVARGFFFNRRIVVGQSFFALPKRQQDAVLAHEEGHCKGWHFEMRLLFLPVFWTRWGRKLAIRQELAADAYAARRGFGIDLLDFLRGDSGGEFYPAPKLRARVLRKRIREYRHATA